MDEFLRSHPWLAWVGAGLAFVIFVILLMHMIKIFFELRRKLPNGERSRQLRLGFVENFDLDGERQLLLVRRDNVEHLLLIGGPNDVLVESGIVRAEVRAPRGAFEQASVAPPPSPSGLVLPPTMAGGQDHLPPPARQEPVERPDTSPSVRPDFRYEPKPNSKTASASEPKAEPLPEIDLEEELKAALEASPFMPTPEPPTPEPPTPPVQPIAPPPPPERLASRFTPPPRPSFRAPLSKPAPALSPSPATPGVEQLSRPRFVIPPLARRNAPPPVAPPEPPPPPAAPPPHAETHPSLAEPRAPDAANDLFAPLPGQAESAPHQPAPSPFPAHKPRSEAETLESLEEEMAKLLGRPPHNNKP